MKERSWWQYDFRCGDASEDGYQLTQIGASGVEEIEATRVRAFVEGSERERSAFLAEAAECGCELLSGEPVPAVNWVAQCADLLKPTQAGALTVRPLLEEDALKATRGEGELLLIPGMGFGTGHHPSTAAVLELMQHPELMVRPPQRVLDVGTGSGILAVAAVLLYGAEVDAIDVDAGALKGAEQNLRLNGVAGSVTLINGDVRATSGTYDLIVANIYAEILVAIEPELRARAKLATPLILAGIATEHAAEVKAGYGEWLSIESKEGAEWCAYLKLKA